MKFKRINEKDDNRDYDYAAITEEENLEKASKELSKFLKAKVSLDYKCSGMPEPTYKVSIEDGDYTLVFCIYYPDNGLGGSPAIYTEDDSLANVQIEDCVEADSKSIKSFENLSRVFVKFFENLETIGELLTPYFDFFRH